MDKTQRPPVRIQGSLNSRPPSFPNCSSLFHPPYCPICGLRKERKLAGQGRHRAPGAGPGAAGGWRWGVHCFPGSPRSGVQLAGSGSSVWGSLGPDLTDWGGRDPVSARQTTELSSQSLIPPQLSSSVHDNKRESSSWPRQQQSAGKSLLPWR